MKAPVRLFILIAVAVFSSALLHWLPLRYEIKYILYILFLGLLLFATIHKKKNRAKILLFNIAVVELILGGLLILPLIYSKLSGKPLPVQFLSIRYNLTQSYADSKRSNLLIYSPLTGRRLKKSQPGLTTNLGTRSVPSADSPSSPYKRTVLLQGGSTTFDTQNNPESSWANKLQDQLNASHGDVLVVNMGLPGATTSEAITQLAFLDYDSLPNIECTVQYHGWNDLRNNWVPALDPSYSNWHLLNQTYRGPKSASSFSPLLSIILFLASRSNPFNAIPYEPSPVGTRPAVATSGNLDPDLSRIFISNLKTISALSKRYGAKVLIVKQQLNYELLNASLGSYGWLPNVLDKELPTLNDALFDQLQQTNLKHPSEGTFILATDQFSTNRQYFADNGHFNNLGARKFADFLHHYIVSHCLDKNE